MLSFLVVFVVSLGLYLLINRQIKFEKKIMILLDRKNKLISEYLEQAKDMKIDGLTCIYKRKLEQCRKEELNLIYFKNIYVFFADILFYTLPVMLSLSIFPLMYTEGSINNIGETFSIIVIFNLLRAPLKYI